MKKDRIIQYILYQVFIYFVLIAINIFYVIYTDNKQDYLDSLIKNKNNEIRLYSLINREVDHIRANIFYMSYASSKWELKYADTNLKKHLALIKKYLEILEKGGEISVNFEVNDTSLVESKSTFKIHYSKFDNSSLNLAKLEIVPKLIELEKLYEGYLNLVTMRVNITSSSYNSYRLVQLIAQIQLNIKAFEPLFNGLVNNTNTLLINSIESLQNLKSKVIVIKKRNNFILKFVNVISVIVLLVFSFFILIRIRKILQQKLLAEEELKQSHENLEEKVRKRTELLEQEIAKRRNAESVIREQADFLTNTLESLSHPFYVIRVSDYKVIMSNSAAKKCANAGADTCFEMTHHLTKPCSGSNHICPLVTIKKTKKPLMVEHIHYNEKGEEVFVEVHAHPIFDKEGNVENIIEYSIDISARKKAEQELLAAYDSLEETVEQRTKELRNTLEEKEKIQEELKKSELYFRKLIENITDIIAISDMEGTLSYISPSVKHILGYKPDELIGEKYSKILHPDDLKTTIKQIEKSIKSLSKGIIINNRCIHKKGHVVYLESHIKALYYDRKLQGIIFTTRDITIRKKNEEEVRKLLSAIEQTPTCIAITDTQGKIEYVNPYFLQLTGYTFDEVIGQNPRVLNAGITPKETFEDLWKTIMSGKVWRGEFINKKKDGTFYDENVIIAPITNSEGKITNYVAVKENITELKKAQQEAIVANQAKSKFLANMSHEIRTPLNGIMGFLQLLSDTDLDDKQRQFVNTILLSADALLKILNDILDFSKLESEMMELDIVEFDLSELVSSVVDMFSAKASEKNIELFSLVDPNIQNYVMGDSLKLTQVLSNLLGNAIKFTSENGEISLILNVISETNDKLKIQFAVYDNGIGIDSENIDKIFGSFSQSDSSVTRKYGGTGLGLAISKKMIELMGGDLKVESKKGAGSKFYFELEFTKGEFIESSILNHFRGKKVCYLVPETEDFVSQLFILGKYFDAMGIDWEIAVDFKLINLENFDITFFDYTAFDVDYINNLAEKHTNLIFCSIVNIKDANKIKYNNLDNLKILIKPVDISKLYNLFSELFLHKSSQILGDKSEFSCLFNASVLLAEDNEVNQMLIKEYLNRFNIEPVIANNGLEAIEFLKTKNFDIIFMDINMPEMDGLKAIEIIKKDMKYKKPVIALTAHALVGDQQKLLDVGFDDYLSKPVSVESLLNILKKYLVNKGICGDSKDLIKSEEISSKFLSDKLKLPDKLLQKLLDKFFIKAEELINDLEREVELKNYEKIYQIAHNLKGMAGNMYFENLKVLSEQIEFDSKNKNHNSILNLLSDIKTEYRKIYENLKK